MSETGNDLDVPALRRGRLTAALVLGTVLLVGAVPILLPMTCIAIGMVQAHAKRSWLVTDVDHLAVRDAGRLLLANHGTDILIEPSQLPDELARLGPNMMAHIDDRGFLRLEFGGGFHHFGLLVVPEDAEGTRLDIGPPLECVPLEDGIWFYEET